MGIRGHLITGFKKEESFSLGNQIFTDYLLDHSIYEMFSEWGDCGLILLDERDLEAMKEWIEDNKCRYSQEAIQEFNETVDQVEKDIQESLEKTEVAVARYYVF